MALDVPLSYGPVATSEVEPAGSTSEPTASLERSTFCQPHKLSISFSRAVHEIQHLSFGKLQLLLRLLAARTLAGTLRMTAAMAAGVVDRLWSIEELIHEIG